jgi:tetratricopeptide (TPR) repeat protein
VNFALKAEVGRTFLDSKGIEYQTARSDGQLSPADVGDLARPFTVQIECKHADVQFAVVHSSRPTARTASLQSILNRGHAYLGNGDNDRAIADYTEAIALDPTLARAYNNRGIAYNNKGDHDRAIADFSDAITHAPTVALPYIGRGNAYRSKGDFDKAIADYTVAIRLNPKFAQAYGNRGWAHLSKGDNDRAAADYTKAIALNEAIALNPQSAQVILAERLQIYTREGSPKH